MQILLIVDWKQSSEIAHRGHSLESDIVRRHGIRRIAHKCPAREGAYGMYRQQYP